MYVRIRFFFLSFPFFFFFSHSRIVCSSLLDCEISTRIRTGSQIFCDALGTRDYRNRVSQFSYSYELRSTRPRDKYRRNIKKEKKNPIYLPMDMTRLARAREIDTDLDFVIYRAIGVYRSKANRPPFPSPGKYIFFF